MQVEIKFYLFICLFFNSTNSKVFDCDPPPPDAQFLSLCTMSTTLCYIIWNLFPLHSHLKAVILKSTTAKNKKNKQTKEQRWEWSRLHRLTGTKVYQAKVLTHPLTMSFSVCPLWHDILKWISWPIICRIITFWLLRDVTNLFIHTHLSDVFFFLENLFINLSQL